MPDEGVRATDVSERSETDLGNDSTKLSRGGRDTVCGGTVTSGEDLTRDDEGGGVGAEVLEEVGHAVEEDEGLGSSRTGDKLVVSETHADESGGEDGEAHELDWLAAPAVDEEEGNPVSGNKTGNRQDQVTNANIPQVVEDFMGSGAGWGSETNSGQDDGGVETKTVESDLNVKQ